MSTTRIRRGIADFLIQYPRNEILSHNIAHYLPSLTDQHIIWSKNYRYLLFIPTYKTPDKEYAFFHTTHEP
jgi:hypothetical protein